MSDTIYLQRCLEIAQRAQYQGLHRPNPLVGAVLVYQNRIIGEGFHQCYGSAHAEVEAFASVQEADRHLLPQATCYVSLEPCFHHGKTPPCIDLLLREGVQRVVIGCQDPFALVAGKSIDKLRAAGVEVTLAPDTRPFLWLNRRFLCRQQKKRPYIILKCASSADGFLGLPGQRTALTSQHSQRLLHQWRSQEAAILVGAETARIDNPKLNNRLAPTYTAQPLRLVLSSKGELHPTLDLLTRAHEQETIVFHTEQLQQKIEAQGLSYQVLPSGQDAIPALLQALQERGIESVFVEGGAKLLQSFLDLGLWDEMRILQNSKILGQGVQMPSPPAHLLHSMQKLEFGDSLSTYYQTWLQELFPSA